MIFQGDAVELDVHQMSSINSGNVFVSVRQNYQVSAWTLPIILPEHGGRLVLISLEFYNKNIPTVKIFKKNFFLLKIDSFIEASLFLNLVIKAEIYYYST